MRSLLAELIIREEAFMSETVDPQANSNNTYVIDPENAAEMARLSVQGRVLTSVMGSLFPASIDPASLHNILDLACGPGEWVFAVAEAYPHIQVTGIDIDPLMISYASYLAVEKKLANAHFQRGNIMQALPFASAQFDFVNARLLFPFMLPEKWGELMQECLRVLRPGGFIRLVDTEVFLSNSAAAQRMQGWCTQALRRAGQSFSVDDHFIGILPHLRRILRDAGFVDIREQPYMINFSAGTEHFQDTTYDLKIAYKQLQPFIRKWHEISQAELDSLYQQMVDDMASEEFLGLWWYLAAWGRKSL
jgi:ubiquinone/menaquinone biosynthesis C-methylase UbiE